MTNTTVAGITMLDALIVYGSAIAGGVAAYFLLYRTFHFGMIESVSLGTFGTCVSIMILTAIEHALIPPRTGLKDPLGGDIKWYK